MAAKRKSVLFAWAFQLLTLLAFLAAGVSASWAKTDFGPKNAPGEIFCETLESTSKIVAQVAETHWENPVADSENASGFTYNLEVEDHHNYFVGNDGVLVHNYMAALNHFFTRALGSKVAYGHKSLTKLNSFRHTRFHKSLDKFLRTQKKTFGGRVVDMAARKGQPGSLIRAAFPLNERVAALSNFTKSYQGGRYHKNFMSELRNAISTGNYR